MEVTFVGLYNDPALGQGMARYCHSLFQALQKHGIRMHNIYCDSSYTFPKKSGFDCFVTVPRNLIFSPKREGIYHITAPQAGLSIPLFKKLRKNKVVTTIYDLHPFLYSSHNVFFPLVARALKSSAQNSDHIVAISSLAKADLIEHFGIPPEKVTVTPLGVEPYFKPLPRKERKFTVGYMGGFAKNKNVPLLIRAYSIFEKTHPGESRFLVYGKGANLEECKSLAKELGIQNIEFMGFAPEENLVEIFNSFDVFVFPSFSEGFGLPILEAQKCQIPTIVLKNAHIPEEVTKFCPSGSNPEEIANEIEKIFHNGFTFSKEHLNHIDQFTWDNCAKKTIEAYKKVQDIEYL